jgi:BirA family biotin operon repressor/biotin-[acetyl-CoA-carboxylase] ligase
MTDTTSPSTAGSPAPGALPPQEDWRIDRERALAGCARGVSDWAIEIVDETASTNADLMQRLKSLPRERAALGQPVVRVAYRQTAGRGRQGRAWHAEPGNALLLSLACVLPRPLAGLAGLSLAVGAVLVEGLSALPLGRDATVALKWPNDVLLDGNKLAGILIETAWGTFDASAVVIGIGINVRSDAALATQLAALNAHLPAQARGTQPAALAQALPGANLTDTFAIVADALAGLLERFSSEGFAPFRERWSAYDAFAGREVVLLEQGVEAARGTALGVDASGQLLLATPAGVQAVSTGDVSLRLAENGA